MLYYVGANAVRGALRAAGHRRRDHQRLAVADDSRQPAGARRHDAAAVASLAFYLLDAVLFNLILRLVPTEVVALAQCVVNQRGVRRPLFLYVAPKSSPATALCEWTSSPNDRARSPSRSTSTCSSTANASSACRPMRRAKTAASPRSAR